MSYSNNHLIHPTIHQYTIGLPDFITTIGDSTFTSSNIFRDVPWGTPISFGEIIIGHGQEPASRNARLAKITAEMARIQNLGGIIVNSYESSWNCGWEPQLVQDFPHIKFFAFRIVASQWGLETIRTIRYSSTSLEYTPSSSSFAQIRVNELTSESVTQILRLENLQVVCLLAPSTLHEQEGSASPSYQLRYLEKLLSNAADLEGISMPFVVLKDVEQVLAALKRSRGLQSINVAWPVTPVELSLASDVNTLITFARGVEKLDQLRK